MTPFRVVYGREETSLHDYIAGSNKTASIESSLLEHQRLLHIMKESIAKAKERMIKQANKNWLEKEFNVSDYVYLRLHKYRQSSVSDRKSQKRSRRFFGPYEIIERIGKVAYHLALPEGTKIHPVFHVSLLKPHNGPTSVSQGNMNDFGYDGDHEYLPANILDTRVNTSGETEVLVKWEKCPIEEAT